MFWWTVLFMLAIFSTLAAIVGIVFTLIEPGFAPIFLLVLAICIGSHIGATQIEKANTEIHTEVVEMEITKCDMTSYHVRNIGECRSYYLTVGNGYVIEVSSNEYANYNVGDTVFVEVETKTIFNEKTETANLFERD